jgi:hypothetical protein
MADLYNSELPFEKQWINALQRISRDLQTRVNEVYIRHAVAINGLHVAHEKYVNAPLDKGFAIASYRQNEFKQFTRMTQREAADLHMQAVSTISKSGIIALYSILEDAIFELCKTYYYYQPASLVQGEEFKTGKEIYKKLLENKSTIEEWNGFILKRLESWAAKKSYDSKVSTLRSLMKNDIKLKAPIASRHFHGVADWDLWLDVLEIFSYLRHDLVHKNKSPSDEMKVLLQRSKADLVNEYALKSYDSDDPYLQAGGLMAMYESIIWEFFDKFALAVADVLLVDMIGSEKKVLAHYHEAKNNASK